MSKAACGSACGNGGGEIYFIATERNVKTSRRNARKRALQSGRQPPPLKSRDPDSRNLRLYTSCNPRGRHAGSRGCYSRGINPINGIFNRGFLMTLD